MYADESILTTGATSTIGWALAEVYARPGTALYLHSRVASEMIISIKTGMRSSLRDILHDDR